MRIYLPPAVNNLIGLIVLIASVSAAVFIGTKAIQTFSSNSALDQIPSVLHEAKPKAN